MPKWDHNRGQLRLLDIHLHLLLLHIYWKDGNMHTKLTHFSSALMVDLEEWVQTELGLEISCKTTEEEQASEQQQSPEC